ncbi:MULTISPECIES: peptidase domain-containing ABC transporter [Bacillus]|uniref:Peptidase domain-containing ABC transporter n=2 Tax=Bacillus cereus TaxID=1396 RepID=A0AAW5KWJ2_BACCE|nr:MULTISPECIES: peptidase domain-containing ABC transporter [Bacillus cereus group]MCQ6286391.1 peptidase domain-containing ABC transporter [Bacillus cereus]MCQ6305577.1 peptidase domain-containing ABC transporter [Bacillus cereus]MCQ6317968.1 peptidase domain-containing ABC transporter [Bacillus cereus]MCQ6325776.1 peptidase domain-containing ABC transporter [Bacillus cereus]MCQ6385785.1 peptidase domain-containing ABC transporter [Bacillus cereus]
MTKYLVKQHDAADCAAACLATVCLYYKKDISITKLRDLLGTDIKGTTLKGLESGAKRLGFDTKAVRVNRETFMSKFSLPAIAHIITKEGLAHFVVVHKITKHSVVFLDPAEGKKKISIIEFFNYFDGILLLLAPNDAFVVERKKKNNTLQTFIRLLMPQKMLFVYSIVASLLLTILGVASAFFNKILMDEILPYNLKNELTIFGLGFLLVVVFQVALSTIRQHILLYLSQKIDIQLLLGFFRHTYKLPMKFFSTRKVGDILTRFSDAFTIKNILTSVTLSLCIDLFLAIASAVVLYLMNSTLFGVILLLTSLNAALVFIFKRPYKKINFRKKESDSILNSQIVETLKGIETIKVHAAEEKTLEKLETEYVKNLRISFKEGVLSNIQNTFSSSISGIGQILLMCIGASMVMDKDITLGGLMAFVTLSGYFMDPIGRLIHIQLAVQEASVSLARISELYDVETEQLNDNKPKVEEISGDIKLENIKYRYGSRGSALNSVSIIIPEGKKVALVGESGSGKTTIAKLLLRYYVPEEGSIRIAGSDIQDLDLYSYRKNISYIPQNIELFSGTIRENITLGIRGATDEQLRRACNDAGCKEFIEKLPGKYDTYLDEAGGGLSGGEKQKIALARALILNNNFTILDEATSNLDFISEANVYRTLFSKKKHATMLIIAHRLSTIQDCDMIYVLDQGKVVEEGTHQSLLENKATYYSLYMSQVSSLPNERDSVSQLEYSNKDNTNRRIGDDIVEYS